MLGGSPSRPSIAIGLKYFTKTHTRDWSQDTHIRTDIYTLLRMRQITKNPCAAQEAPPAPCGDLAGRGKPARGRARRLTTPQSSSAPRETSA